MKWEKIKKQVASEVHSRIMQSRNWEAAAAILVDLCASNFTPKRGLSNDELRKVYADKAEEVIMQWDVRAVHRLRDLFPVSFPVSLSSGKLQADYDDQGDWAVVKV